MPSEFERLQAALPQRYTLLRELDRGGMSRVYLARESLPERDVALKVLDEELSARLGRERFVREVEVTSSLSHPHIVPIYSAGDAGGTLYYVMPYIEGESLRDRLGREDRLPIEDALKITHQIADALQHAHDKGIVHRDIKPSNILFQSGHAVVADFGIARALRAAESGGEFTQSGLPLGTPDYMSPEQAGGDGPVDGRTDTYALACVLYEMLAGQPPFHSRTAQATLARHLTDTMPSLRSVRSSVPRGVEQVIAQALSKAPADRPREVTHFADALMVANQSGLESVQASHSGRRGFGSLGVPARLAGALLVVAAFGVAMQVWSWGMSLFADDRWETSVGVLPFDDRTNDPTFEYLGVSLADEIIGHLKAVAEVKVIDRYTATSYWEQKLGTPALLDSLAVENIIYGNIERIGDSLVVSAWRSDREGSLSRRWRYGVDPADLGSRQVEIAHQVAINFLADVGVVANLSLADDDIGPGRDAYLTGISVLGQRTPEAIRRAIRQLQLSIQIDSGYAPAHAGLSSAYALALYYKYDVGVLSYDLATRSLAAADAAVTLDPDFADGYSARGYIRALLGIEIDAAEADFDRARELEPNSPNGASWSARILAQRGQVDEAFEEARAARDLDPRQAGRRTALASLGFQLGDYETVIEEAREAYRLEDQLLLARAFEGRALAMTGRGMECLDLELGVYELVRALCLHSAGRAGAARTMVQAAARDLTASGVSDPNYVDELVAQDLASYFGLIGDPAGATRWLRFAFDLSPAGIDERILGSQLFAAVRDDPGFSAAVEQVRAGASARIQAARDGG